MKIIIFTIICFFVPSFVPPKIDEFLEEMVNTIIDHREKNNVTQNDFLQMIIKNREKALSEVKPNDKAAIGMYENYFRF